jgi:uncharacterized damage-inducible protein DinB
MREFQTNLAYLFRRDLKRLSDEISKYPDDDTLGKLVNGINNSAANLTLHLTGNLNHFVGHQLGGSGYERDREAEFGRTDITKNELLDKLADCQQVVADSLQKIDDEQLDNMHDPGFITGETMSIRQFLMHLYGHLNYHLGQINYHRRILS